MPSRPEIFHLICRKGIGGVQSQFETYCKNLDKQQLQQMTVIEPCTRNGFKSYMYLIWQLLGLVYKCRRKSTVVHVYNGLVSSRYLVIFSLIRPINLVHHERGNIWNLPAGLEWLARKNASLAKIILCNSEATKTLLSGQYEIQPSKLHVLYNGVHSAQDRELYCLSGKDKDISENFEVGFVGRLEPHKGVHVLIDAIARLNNNGIHLTIVGDGSQKHSLEAQASQLGIDVTFTGRLDDSLVKMQQFDCLVVPSIREPLGNVIIEAGILGKTVIASKVDGIPEIIEHQENGILVKADEEIPKRYSGFRIPIPRFVIDSDTGEVSFPRQLSSEKLASEILYLRNNFAERKRLGSNLRNSVLTKFSIEKYTDELSRVYERLINEV